MHLKSGVTDMYYVIFDKKILFQSSSIREAEAKAQEQAKANALLRCSEPVIVCKAAIAVTGAVNVFTRIIEDVIAEGEDDETSRTQY